MTYADFTYYREEYLGTTVPEEEFERAMRRAGARMDRMTRFRAEAFAARHPEEKRLKSAACAVADALYAAEKAGKGAMAEGGRPVVSESNDGYSVTYAPPREPQAIQAELDMALREAAGDYLLPLGLLYAGVRRR